MREVQSPHKDGTLQSSREQGQQRLFRKRYAVRLEFIQAGSLGVREIEGWGGVIGRDGEE